MSNNRASRCSTAWRANRRGDCWPRPTNTSERGPDGEHRMQPIRQLLSAVCLLACLSSGPAVATEFKIATVAPEGSDWMREMRAAARDIRAATDGRVTVKFYTGGVMGNEKKVLRKIRIGQLHGGAFTASGLYERYPDIVVYGLPLVFRNEDEVAYVRKHLDPLLEQGLQKAGFVSFGFAGGGFAMLMGNERVTRFEQLRGRKAWIPEGDRLSYVAMEALNLSPVVLPITDVLTGLQTGLVEFIASPPVAAVVLQWHTKVHYLTDIPLAYTLGALVVDQRAFMRLSEADRQAFAQRMRAAYARIDAQARSDNASAMQALLASGLQVVDLPPAEAERWRQAARRANEALVQQEVISRDIYQRLMDLLAAYRAGAAPAPATAGRQ
ncbi:MAG: C4-dicarboxylate ABC transporter [Gammaproteobacteria bacterium]|nr:MAG: C4-dicarboxylate ABC transporter [Gammaproteobacteria bacterium]